MPTRDRAPVGAPCWADLLTSDVEGSRRFYSEVFGWEPQEPSEEFGGYFMFTRNGQPIAGGMGSWGEDAGPDRWTIYLATDDIAKTLETVEAEGGRVLSPAMQVADLGSQAVIADPTGGQLGTWQPDTFHGFPVVDESNAPSWCELLTSDYPSAIAFYPNVFRLGITSVGDSDEFRYSTLQADGKDVAGVMDAKAFLPESVTARWSIYWQVESVDATIETVQRLGGTVVMPAEDTPYGRLAVVTDPAGAEFKLRVPPSA